MSTAPGGVLSGDFSSSNSRLSFGRVKQRLGNHPFAYHLTRLPNIQSENLFLVPPELPWEEIATHRSSSIA